MSMAKIVGEKRSAGNTTNQTKLPKKKKGFPGGATKNKILAEAGNQPCQKQ